jgi:surfeit locus 1 family protein
MASTKNRIFVIFIVTAIAVCIKLGFWQINRLEWKTNLISKIEAAKIADPYELNLNNFDADRDLYRRIYTKGEFINTQEIYLGGKYLNEAQKKNEIGVHVITPFRLKTGEVIFVNRGWVPQSKKERMERPESTIEGEVLLEAIIRENKGKPPSFMPANMPGKNVWFWIDIPAMTKYLEKNGIKNIKPVLLQQTNLTVKNGDLPKPVSTKFEAYNEHKTYIYTWFGIALGLAVMLGFWIKSKK